MDDESIINVDQNSANVPLFYDSFFLHIPRLIVALPLIFEINRRKIHPSTNATTAAQDPVPIIPSFVTIINSNIDESKSDNLPIRSLATKNKNNRRADY
jgi:hypothetical protein